MALLVLGVQPRELGEHLGVVVRALLGGRARGEASSLPIAGCASRTSSFSSCGSSWTSVRARTSGSGSARELLDEARPTLEELGELVGAQLPR